MKVPGNLAVDTNAVIAYREGIPEVCRIVDDAEILFLPVPVLGELLYGAMNSVKRKDNELAVQNFSEYTILLPITLEVAARYAGVRFLLKKKGTPIPENDIWIAAACIENEIPLLSNDGHFSSIDNLNVICWQNETVRPQ